MPPADFLVRMQSNIVLKNSEVSFYSLQVSFGILLIYIPGERGEFFWRRLKERTSALAGRQVEHLECREILCFHLSKVLFVSASSGCKTLKEWIRYLYESVIDCLFVTSPSIRDRREQMWRLKTSH